METQQDIQNQSSTAIEERESTSSIKDGIRSAPQKIASSAREATQSLKEQAGQAAQNQKEEVAGGIHNYSQALQGAADRLKDQQHEQIASWTDALASRLDQLAVYLRKNDFSALTNDASALARKQPELFYGGMFFAGFLLTRFVKATQPSAGESGSRPIRSTSTESWTEPGIEPSPEPMIEPS